MDFNPTWIGLGITVGGLAFSAGGVVIGMKLEGRANKQTHTQLNEKISHLDKIKQSAMVCNERHMAYDSKLDNLTAKTGEISDDVKWLVRTIKNGGSRG